MKWGWAAGLAVLAAVCVGGSSSTPAAEPVVSRAAQMVTLPTPAVMDQVPNTVKVPVARATCAAMSDQHNLLLVGTQAVKAGDGKELYVFKLGPNGEPSGPPELISMPKPPEVNEFPNQILSIKFHPRLPLVYVWQDTEDKKTKRAEASNASYPHLVIYSIDGAGKLNQVATSATGMRFDINNLWGDMAISPDGSQLYIPNARTPARTGFGAVGVISLDPKTGMVVMEDYEEKAGAKPVKREEMAIYPLLQLGSDSIPTGNGFVLGSKGNFITNGYTTILNFDPNNRQAKLIGYYPPWAGGNIRLSAHPDPKIWRFYATNIGAGSFYSMAHADGYTTGVPQSVSVPGLICYSEALVLTKRSRIAIGSQNAVMLVTIMPNGQIANEAVAIKVNNPAVRAIAYSPRSDKLFVAEAPGK